MQKLIRVTQPTLAVLEVLLREEYGTWGLHIAKQTGLKPGTIYPILERLEAAGWVISVWETEITRAAPKRKNFLLLAHARATVEELIRLKRKRR